MDQITLETGQAPEITIVVVGGDLRLMGWERNELQAESDADRSLSAEQEDSRLVLSAQADCAVRVPRHAALTIENVGGEARVKSLEGPAEIRRVGGDLNLRQTLDVTLGHVGGDVNAKKVHGSLHLDTVGGDVSARSVAGDFAAGKVGGDLYLRDVAGSITARAVGGDTSLNVAFVPGKTYELQAGGDVLCRVPRGLSAQFTLESGGDIAVDVLGAQIQGDARHKLVTLGDGAAQVKLRAGRDVALTDLSADPEAMGDFGEHFGEEFEVMAEEFAAQIQAQVGSQIEAEMAQLEKQLAERLADLDVNLGAGRAKAEKIAARVRRTAERAKVAQRRAERHAEAALRRAERHAEAAERRAAAGARRWGRFQTAHVAHPFAGDRSPRPTPPAEAVSDEERMTILRMVEQGKITVAEAEKLLAALEGEA